MTHPPANLLPWKQLRVWILDPVLRATRELNERRAIVALAQWRVGEAAANTCIVDVRDARQLGDPSEVDWSGFPPSANPSDG
jgi:hypothetical protein